MHSEYQYVASFHRHGQRSALTQVPLDVDWIPAEECARLAALRSGRCPQHVLPSGDIFAEPVWHREAGEPYLSGLRVSIQVGGKWVVEELDSDYFLPAVMQASSSLVKAGALQDGEDFAFLVLAFRREDVTQTPARPPGQDIEEVVPLLPIHSTDFETLLKTSTPLGINDLEDVPVFIPAAVLDEIIERTRSAGAAETGGILIGKMHRDPLDAQTLFFSVTAQVPMVRCATGLDRLTFTPEVWAAANAAIRLRGQGELYGGWWHCHPAFACCEDCPPQKRESCPIRDPNGFFSEADCALHRNAFPRAYNVGLVATHVDGEVWFAGFGWRKGRIARRGLRVTGACRAYEPGEARGCSLSGGVRNGTPCK